MPYDKQYYEQGLPDWYAKAIEQLREPRPSLPKIVEPPAPEPPPFVHGELYTVSSGKTYRWITNHPDHPQGCFAPPDLEWQSGEYANV